MYSTEARNHSIFSIVIDFYLRCNYIFVEIGNAEEDSREHKQQAGSGDEEWQIHSWLQDRPQNP